MPRFRAIVPLAESDWETFTETVAHVAMGWSEGEVAHEVALLFRKAVTKETYLRFLATSHDASGILHEVAVPTLIGHERGAPHHEIGFARELAAGIPSSRLLVIDVGSDLNPSEDAIIAMEEFLDEGREAALGVFASGLVTILFTDMEGSTSLTQRLGDAAAQDVLRTHNSIVRDALKAHSGTEIKHTGDGIMASFTAASAALEAAVAIQKALADHNQANAPIRVRIGLNAGEPVAEDEDLFGTAVQLADRVCDRAEPGQILVADVVEQLAAGKGFAFDDKGEATLKGFASAITLSRAR